MGDPDDLRRMLEAFEERNAVASQHEETMGRLVEGVTALSVQVGTLRQELATRPTKQETDHRRRKFTVGTVAFAIALASLIDAHTEGCGPGSRAERSLDALSHGAKTTQEIIDAGRPRESPGCDLAVPFHGHSGATWPTPWSYAGGGVYILGLGALSLWARGPRRVPSEPDPEEKP